MNLIAELNETSSALIMRLIDDGKLTLSEAEDYIVSSLSMYIEQAAEWLHLNFCREDHTRENCACLFHQEKTTVKPWIERDHKFWLNKTFAIAKHLECTLKDLWDAMQGTDDIVSVIGKAELKSDVEVLSPVLMAILTRHGHIERGILKILIKGENDAEEKNDSRT